MSPLISIFSFLSLFFWSELAVSVRPLRIWRPQQHQCRSLLLLWCYQESHCCVEITSGGNQQDRTQHNLSSRLTHFSSSQVVFNVSPHRGILSCACVLWLLCKAYSAVCFFYLSLHSEGSLHHTRGWHKDKERINFESRAKDSRRAKDKRGFHEMWVISFLLSEQKYVWDLMWNISSYFKSHLYFS